uniref:Uncharacterized protein n=1 Tax=Plectus sambesii TaxID=2011161 RepID=A0A914X5G6_9BILA
MMSPLYHGGRIPLFPDVAVKQVEEAGNQLMKDVNDPKNPMAEHLAKVLKETLPSDCAYMLAPQQFRDAVDAAGNSTESNPPPPNVPQIDQPIANPESAPEASITTVNLETTTVNLETTTVNLETTTAGSPSSGSQNMTEDNRTIEKEPVNSQNASGNVIASALTVFFVILFACF